MASRCAAATHSIHTSITLSDFSCLSPLEVPWRVHPGMQNADDRDAVPSNAKIDRMSPNASAPVAFPNIVAEGAELRTPGELIKSGCQFVGVSVRLIDPPFFERMKPYRLKIANRRRA